MTAQLIIDNLYRELLLAAAALFSILLFNTLVLYRRKLNDPLSLMLLASVIMCAFETMWEYCDGHLPLRVLTYIGGCGYVVMFLIFGATFSRFFLAQFALVPKKKWINTMIYIVPGIIYLFFCVTTPWTRLVFWVDENGILQEMVLFRAMYLVLIAYLCSAIFSAIYFAVLGRHRNPAAAQASKSLIIFGVLAPGLYLLEIFILGNPDSDYLALSLPIAIALVYLTTNISTHSLLESQAKIEEVETDLRIAAKIQSDALAPTAPEFEDLPELNLRASMDTAREVGGDFYDYFAIDDRRLCILIADVSGKGTPAALFMMTVKTTIKDHAFMCGSTAEIFTAVNQRLCENNTEGMFATAWIGIYDTETRILQYTNAGHSYPLFLGSGESCVILKKVHGLFLAGLDGTQYRQSELQMHEGDRLLLYTDGITEAHDRSSALYGMDRLIRVLEAAAGESGESVLERVTRDVNTFAQGTPQFDDMTMLILTIKNR